MNISDWHSLYSDGWKGEITPAAFAHPAKFSRALIRHIYKHAIEEGWLVAGDTVVDPFGGVGLGAIDAMLNGLNWVGVELEQKFVDLGNQNIDLWDSRYNGKVRTWGTAQLIQGDSRNLGGVIEQAGACVSSPPYAESLQGSDKIDHTIEKRNSIHPEYGNARAFWGVTSASSNLSAKGYGSAPGNLGNLPANDYAAAVSSPPFLAQSGGTNVTAKTGPLSDPRLLSRHSAGNAATEAYGSDPANLGNLPAGDFSVAISSPPYAESIHEGQGGTGVTSKNDKRNQDWKGWQNEHAADLDGYGATSGQLGAMGAGDYAAAVSSPPFENGSPHNGGDAEFIDKKRLFGDYGETPGNIGNSTGDGFWTAARQIVEQVHTVLRPGGAAIFVVKSFVKNKQIVDFPHQWQELCEAVGFQTIHEHRAWLVEDKGAQWDLFGELHEKTVERKSFFRRLAEKNGAPRIDWETVLCMTKVISNT
jgi:hypothetical protein